MTSLPGAVRAGAPCRADLAGGTLDIWPLGLLTARPARTVNVAIDVRVAVTLKRRAAGYAVRQGEREREAPSLEGLRAHHDTRLVAGLGEAIDLPPVTVTLESASPRGAGLGASSALAIALIAAAETLTGRRAADPRARAALVRDVEARLMRLPTGVQDQYPPQLGGVLAVRYRPGGETVERLAVDLEALGACFLVAYSGQSHVSAESNWLMVRRALDGDRDTVTHLDAIADVAAELEDALVAGDLARAGVLLSREHDHRRRLARGIATPRIEALLAAAAAAGAWGGKVCGAGGGGCIVVLCPPERRAAVAGALGGAGGEVLPARPAVAGVSVEARAEALE